MELQRAIIHELIKEKKQKDRPAIEPIIVEGQLLDVGAEAVTTLVDSVVSIYGTKGNSSAQGTFDHDGDYRFPSHLDSFIAGGDTTFKEFTDNAMNCLKTAAGRKNFATGGYLVFGHYKSTAATSDNEMLLIAMVKKRNGITLHNLVPETIQEVDLSKLHQAVKINITKYKNWQQQEEQVNIELNSINSYLSFVSPKTSEEASGYFIDAIGCTNAVADKKATKDVLDAVSTFFNSDDRLKPLKKHAKEEVASKLYEQSQSENPECSLDTVDAWVTAILPDELQDEYANKFTEHANNEPHNVPSVFKSNATEAKKGISLKIGSKDNGWSLNMERSLLGTERNSAIRYDSGNNQLIIRELPDNIVRNLMTALGLNSNDENTSS